MRRPGQIARIAALAAAAIVLATPSRAYYQYVHYTSRNAPFTPIYEKFDLLRLPNNTVTFFVSSDGPRNYAQNDSFGSVVSQVRQALAAWNSVSTSDLRVAFGGLEGYTANPTAGSPGSPLAAANTPGGDVIFIDLPGVVGLGAPTTSSTPVNGPNGPFYPILRGLVMLSRDTSTAPGPSYLEKYFTTAVHEVGHALGLQHTWTSSAMSQGVIRNTSRSRPLDADDVAALSVLYGKQNWQSAYGSITGRVTIGNQPASLASVVAIAPAGAAVSTLTNPDGTYRIDGVPPGGYLVYAHPLPPDALSADESGLRLPVDQNRNSFPASGPFQTQFFPGTLDPNQASVLNVGPGAVVGGVNFSVQSKAAVPIYDVVTYCRLNTNTRTYIWSGDLTVPQPTGGLAFMDSTVNQPGALIIQAQPPIQTPVPQSATILGGIGGATFIQAYSDPPGSPQAVVLYFRPPTGAGTGPRHLVLNFGNDIYVQPDAVTMVQRGPPVISSITPNSDGSATVTGAGLGPDSSVYFDGLQATVLFPFNGTPALGSIMVQPPQGAAGQVSTVTVYNADSQNSMILQAQNPPTYTYPPLFFPQIGGINLTSLPAGSSAAIDVTLTGANAVDGQVTVGFGSNDITVRRVWVLSPTHLVANVVVAPAAALGTSDVSVISGLQVMSQPGAFQVQPSRAGLPLIALPVVNNDAGQQTIYPGSVAAIFGQNLATGSSVQVTLNDLPMAVQFASAGQVNIIIPQGFPTGPATLRLSNGSQPAFPVMVQIDNPPPVITNVTNVSGVSLASIGATVGDLVNLLVAGLDPGAASNLSRLRVTVSGVDMQILGVTAQPNGVYQVQFFLNRSFGGSTVPVALWVDGSSSTPVNLAVR